MLSSHDSRYYSATNVGRQNLIYQKGILHMISIKLDSKGKPTKALGHRTRQSSIYSPGQSEVFKISRSKFDDFLKCRKCFYLDRVCGLSTPSMPGWTLNETTDLLLKREFDRCRESQVPHRIFGEFGLDSIVPFDHPNMDKWRNSLAGGVEHQIENTNIIFHGGVDDIWHNKNTDQIIIVDYKSQASTRQVTTEDYLGYVFHQSYKIQMDVYSYLMSKNGFDVFPTAYFYVCNADRNAETFSGELIFSETLVPYNWDTSWIDEKLKEMITTLNSKDLPDSNPSCENCAYARQRTLKEAG